MMEMIFRVTDQKYDAEILINVRKKAILKQSVLISLLTA